MTLTEDEAFHVISSGYLGLLKICWHPMSLCFHDNDVEGCI